MIDPAGFYLPPPSLAKLSSLEHNSAEIFARTSILLQDSGVLDQNMGHISNFSGRMFSVRHRPLIFEIF